MKITIEFKPDCSLQDKLEALEYLTILMDTKSKNCTYVSGGTYGSDNGYSIQITE